MKNPLAWLATIAVLAAVVAGYFYWRAGVAPEAPPPPVAVAPPAPAPADAPPILHPVPEPQAGTPLPSLAESDPAMKDALTGLFGRESYSRYFYPDGIVRRFVATIDNLPRKTAANRLMPVKPVPGSFVMAGSEAGLGIGAPNALRYRPYVVAMESADAKKLVATYFRFYPLFQNAYRELGYPNGHFNDRLVQAIDDLLAAPAVAAPRLTQPKVLYVYADPDLEDRSAGQKIMIRMGTDNAARVKAKLRAIRQELTQQPTPP